MQKILLFIILAVAPLTLLKAQFSIIGQQPTCSGYCNGSARVNSFVHAPYRYLWSTGDTIDLVSDLCAGTYQCIVFDSLRAPLDTLHIAIPQPPPLVITPATLKNEPCNGDSTGYVIFHTTGGTGNRYSFTWSTGNQGFIKDSDHFFLPAGNYSITITDANACSASAGFSIIQPSPIVVSPQITGTTACNACNGSISVGASGGSSVHFTYSWSNGATTSVISNLCAGGYNLSVADTTGCSVITHLNVLPDQSSLAVLFSTATNIDCSHPTGFLFATPSGGNTPYHYKWSTGSTAPDIFNLQAGVYQVSVTDSLGCFAIATDTIKNTGLQITTLLQQNFRCDVNTGKIEVAISQGSPPYILRWNTNAATDTLNGLLPGNYTLTVTDQASCSATASYTIAQLNTVLTARATGTNVTCLNINNGSAIVNVSGGLAPYRYLWNDSTHQAADSALHLAAGNYQVRVTDAFNCSVFAGVSIVNNYSSQVNVTTSIGNCDSTGSATATISTGAAPYTYLWNSVPTQSNATLNSVQVGNYTVSVTDATGCIRTGIASIEYSCIGLVTGTVFYDNNANCIIDNGEHGIPGIPILVSNNHVTFEGITNLLGEYSIPVTAAGGYKIITGVSASSAILQYGNNACGYLEACPGNDSVTFITLKDTFQHYNFGYVGSTDFDLAINAGWNAVNPNQVKEYWVLYANQAFLLPYTNTATVTFNYDSNLIFQSGVPAPNNNTATHTLTWTVDSVPSPSYIWADRLRAFFSLPTDLAPDYELKNEFHIEPYAGDCDTTNNSIYTQQLATLPARPASKEVYPRGDISPGDSVLTYTIYFQNTGSATASVIKITDSLSPYLDPASVQNIASSPLYNQFYIGPGVVLTWIFNPANVPASATDSLGSRGFVSFTGKLKPVNERGYSIKNNAQVSINNGTSTVTNTTSNFIAYPLAVVEVPANALYIKVMPNPFNSTANVLVNGIEGNYDFEMSDMTGKVVRKITSIATSVFQINREGLAAGIYIYKVSSNHNPAGYGKLIIE